MNDSPRGGREKGAEFRQSCRADFFHALIFVFFFLRPAWGWKWSLAATVALVAAYFWVQEEWVLKRNERNQSIVRRVNEHFKVSNAASPPTLILGLRRVTHEASAAGL